MILIFNKDIKKYPFFKAFKNISKREIEIKSADYFTFVEVFTEWKEIMAKDMYFTINVD